MLNIPRFFRSFQFAVRGIVDLFRFENNAKFHLLAALTVVGAGFWFGLTTMEWVAVTTQVGLVMAAEGVNTAIEKLADRVTTDRDPLIRAAKDLSSGAVLIIGIMALVVGLLIFVPKVLNLIGR